MIGFGKKDREDTSWADRLFSVTALTTIYGVSMRGWKKRYKHNVKSIFGRNIPYPSSEGFKEFQNTILNIFPWMKTGDMDAVQGSTFKLDQQVMAGPSVRKDLIDSIKQFEKELNMACGDYKHNIKQVINKVGVVYNKLKLYNVNKSLKDIGKFGLGERQLTAVVQNASRVGKLQTGMMSKTIQGKGIDNWLTFIDESMWNDDPVSFIRNNVTKDSGLQASSLESGKLESVPLSVLREYKKKTKEFLFHTRNKNIHLKFYPNNIKSVHDIPEALNNLKGIVEDRYKFPKYVNSSSYWWKSVSQVYSKIHNVSKLMREIPTIENAKSVDSFIRQAFPDYYHQLGKIFKKSGVSRSVEGWGLGKSQLKLMEYVRPGFNHLSKMYDLIFKQISDDVSIKKFRVDIQPMTAGTKFSFNVSVSFAGRRPVNLKLPFVLPEGTNVQQDLFSPIKLINQEKMRTGTAGFMEAQIRYYKNHLNKFINMAATGDVTSTDKLNVVENNINKMVDRSYSELFQSLILSQNADMRNIAKFAEVGPWEQRLQSMGQLNVVEQGITEVEKFHAALKKPGSRVTIIDIARDRIPAGKMFTKRMAKMGYQPGDDFLKDISLITYERTSKGIQVKSNTLYKLTANKGFKGEYGVKYLGSRGFVTNLNKFLGVVDNTKMMTFPVDETRLSELLPAALQGKVIMNNASDDINALLRVLSKKKGHAYNVSNVARQLAEKNVIEFQKMIKSDPKALGATSIENVPDLIQKYIDSMKDKGVGMDAINTIIRQTFGQNVDWKTLKASGVFHFSPADNTYPMLLGILMSEFGWDAENNQYANRKYLKQLDFKFEPYAKGFINPSNKGKGIKTLFEPKKLISFYEAKSQVKAWYQIVGGTKSIDYGFGQTANWKGFYDADKSGRWNFPAVSVASPRDDHFKGLRHYMHNARVLLTNAKETYESQIWANENWLRRFMLVGHDYAILKRSQLPPDYSSYKVGKIPIVPGMEVGKLFSKNEYIGDTRLEFPARITSVALQDGKVRVNFDYMLKTGVGTKILGLGKGLVTKSTNLNEKIDFVHFYNPYKSGEPGVLMDIMLGRLSTWAGRDPQKQDALCRAVKRFFPEDLTMQQDNSQRLVAKVSPHFNDMTRSMYKPWMYRMVNMWKYLGLTMDKPELEDTVLEKGKLIAHRKWTDIEKRAGIAYLKDTAEQPFGIPYLSTLMQESEKKVKKMVFEVIHKNAETTQRLFSSKYISIFESFRETGLKSPVVIGTRPYLSNVFGDPVSQFGLGGKDVKVNAFMLKFLEHQPGAGKLFEATLQDVQEQSAPILGRLHQLIKFGQQKTPPAGAMDVMSYFNEIEAGKKGVELKEGLEQLLNPSSWGKYAKLKHMNFYKLGTEIYPENVATSMSNFADMESIRYEEVQSRIIPRKVADLLSSVQGKYAKLDRAVFANVPGAKEGAYNKYMLLFNDRFVSHADGDWAIGSQLSLAQLNLLQKLKAGGPGMDSIVQKIYDITGAYNIKSNFHGLRPGMQGLINFAEPYVAGAKGALGEYTSESVLSFETLLPKSWAKNNSSMIFDQVKKMSLQDMQFSVKYLRNYNEIVKGSSITTHPFYNQLKGKIIGDKNLSIDNLFDMVQNNNLKNITKKQLQNYWSNAVGKGVFIPGQMTRWPLWSARNMPPTMLSIRNMKESGRPAAGVDAIVKISSFLGKMIWGDADGDRVYVQLAPKGMKEFFQSAVNTGMFSKTSPNDVRDAIFEEINIENGDLLKRPKYLQWDYKTRDYVYREQSDIFARIREMYKKDGAMLSQKMLEEMAGFIKKAPPRALMMITSGLTFAESKGWDVTTKNQVVSNMSFLGEWGTKQKNITGGVHLVDEVFNSLQNITDKASQNRLMQIIDPKTPYMHKWIDMGKEHSQLLSPDTSLGEHMLGRAPKGTWDFIKQQTGKMVQGDMTNMNLYVAMAGEQPNIFKFGTPEYQNMFSRNSDVARNIVAGLRGGAASRYLSQFGLHGLNLYAHPEKPFFESMKHAVVNKFGESIWKNAELLGKGVGIAAAGYVALNLFRPDQMKSLGHMPGTGGEKWDYAFTNPELDWSQLIQTPLGNPSDLPKAYVEMFSIKGLENREKKNRPVIPFLTFKNEFGAKAYHRNNYSAVSHNIDSIGISEKLRKYGQ